MKQPDKKSVEDENGMTPEEYEDAAFSFYGHIWNLLQQNPFFIQHGFYVFPNGERWTIEELVKHADGGDPEDSIKAVLQ